MIEPHWLSRIQVEAIHDNLVCQHGGLPGIRDENALEASVARPINLFLHGQPDIPSLAATYAHGIANNHPFLDGNKRTAFVVADVFLKWNGFAFSMTEREAVTVMVNLAAGTLSQLEFAEYIRKNIKKGAEERAWIKARKRRD